MRILPLVIMLLTLGWATTSIAEDDQGNKRRPTVSAERKAEWEKMHQGWEQLSKEEKLKRIEAQRSTRIKEREDRWNGMSADEKIAQHERFMQRREKMMQNRSSRDGGPAGDRKGPPPAPEDGQE